MGEAPMPRTAARIVQFRACLPRYLTDRQRRKLDSTICAVAARSHNAAMASGGRTVFNPNSGSSPEIEALRSRIVAAGFELIETRERGDARRLAADARRGGQDLVVAAATVRCDSTASCRRTG